VPVLFHEWNLLSHAGADRSKPAADKSAETSFHFTDLLPNLLMKMFFGFMIASWKELASRSLQRKEAAFTGGIHLVELVLVELVNLSWKALTNLNTPPTLSFVASVVTLLKSMVKVLRPRQGPCLRTKFDSTSCRPYLEHFDPNRYSHFTSYIFGNKSCGCVFGD